MRPRHLYNAVFAWLVLSGGRFTAPFLEEVARFDDTLTGLALALQFGLMSLLGSAGGMVADRLEARSPHRGRCAVLAFGMGTSTAAFVLHGAVGGVLGWGTAASVGAHMLLRVVFSVGLASVMPVLDGLTLAYLEEEGLDRGEYGKERVYGVVGWGVASVVVGPFIDRFGFEVMFWFAPLSFLWCLATILVFSKESARIRPSLPTDECTPLNRIQVASDDSAANDALDSDSNGKATLWSLLGVLFGSLYATGFVISCIALSMGTSVVESLIFLFFRELGGSNTMCGLTVVVTVLFEVPIFQMAPQLLQQLGVVGLQALACLAYITRVLGYTFIPPHKVLLVLFLEPLHGVTYAFAKTGGVEFVAELAPKGYEASCQGLLASFLGVGSVVGLSLGGWAEDALGAKTMYRLYAGVVTCGLVVLALVARRREIISVKQSMEQLNISDEPVQGNTGVWDACSTEVEVRGTVPPDK